MSDGDHVTSPALGRSGTALGPTGTRSLSGRWAALSPSGGAGAGRPLVIIARRPSEAALTGARDRRLSCAPDRVM